MPVRARAVLRSIRAVVRTSVRSPLLRAEHAEGNDARRSPFGAFSDRVKAERLLVVDEFKLDKIKTKTWSTLKKT